MKITKEWKIARSTAKSNPQAFHEWTRSTTMMPYTWITKKCAAAFVSITAWTLALVKRSNGIAVETAVACVIATCYIIFAAAASVMAREQFSESKIILNFSYLYGSRKYVPEEFGQVARLRQTHEKYLSQNLLLILNVLNIINLQCI